MYALISRKITTLNLKKNMHFLKIYIILFTGEQIIWKGYLNMHKGAYQRKEVYWFVLTTQNLHWFTANDEKIKEFTLPLENLKLKDLGVGGVLHARYKFSICHNQGANVYKEKDSLELSCDRFVYISAVCLLLLSFFTFIESAVCLLLLSFCFTFQLFVYFYIVDCLFTFQPRRIGIL